MAPNSSPASARPVTGSLACSTWNVVGATIAPSSDHAAEPDDQREHVHVPQRKHPRIIIPVPEVLPVARARRPLACSRAHEHRDAPAHRLGACHHRGRQRPSEHVLLGGRDRRGAVLCRDAVRPARPAEPGQRSVRAVEGARGADPVRRVGRGGVSEARRPADAAAARFRSRRASDAAAAVCRRRHRVARPGAVRGRRHRAQRAAHRAPTTAPTCCSATANRRKARSGRPPTSPAFDKLDSLCGITDVNALGQSGPTQWQHDMEALAGRWRALRLARDRRGRPRPAGDPRRAREGAADEGPADDDPGEDAQGQGHLVRWKGRAAGTARR